MLAHHGIVIRQMEGAQPLSIDVVTISPGPLSVVRSYPRKRRLTRKPARYTCQAVFKILPTTLSEDFKHMGLDTK